MGLIVIQSRAPTVVGGFSRRAVDGVGVASVVIDESKHLIVTLTNGVTHDAGQLPSSDEVEELAQALDQVAQRVRDLEALGQAVTALGRQQDEQGQAITSLTNGQSTQAQAIESLSERLTAVEQGTPTDPTDPEVPENALTGAGGELLVTASGEYLVFGSSAEPTPANALTDESGELLTSSAGQILTTGEVA